MGKKKIADKGQAAPAMKDRKESTPKRKKNVRQLESGRIYVKSSYNNTIITVTDDKGEVVAWATAGSTGFSGPKKATPFAASKIVATIVEKTGKTGPKKVDLFVSGIGPGRDSAIRSLANQGFEIMSIKDVTPIAHNGPRAKKERKP